MPTWASLWHQSFTLTSWSEEPPIEVPIELLIPFYVVWTSKSFAQVGRFYCFPPSHLSSAPPPPVDQYPFWVPVILTCLQCSHIKDYTAESPGPYHCIITFLSLSQNYKWHILYQWCTQDFSVVMYYVYMYYTYLYYCTVSTDDKCSSQSQQRHMKKETNIVQY